MQEEERLNLREAADALGISEVTARRWVHSGKLRASKPGLKYLIPRSAVDDLLGVVSPKVRGWFEPDNADRLNKELKARGFDLLAMDSSEFEDYAKDKSYREVARQAWKEWAEVRDNPELQHLKSLANHRVAAYLTYLPGPTAPARPSREFLEFVDELDDSSLAELESDLMPVERSLSKEGDPNFEKVGIHRFITGLKGQIRRGSVSAEKSLDRELQNV